jgi:hypothetical protein
MPLQIVVEDVGWWSIAGKAGSNEPFGTGMGRRHCPRDYEALITLGRRLGMRPLAAFVACEWDRTNLLKEIPSTTWMGAAWDNGHNRGPWLDEAAHILRRNRQHLEIGLHGVGHEYWQGGRLSRSEFHDRRGVMRPREKIERHLEAFGEILDRNDLGPYPEAFVPPALNHSFGNDQGSIQCILRDFGIKYVTTIFGRARAWSPPRYKCITWECGVVLVERGEASVPWHVRSAWPRFSFNRPVLSLHWANLLHSDPARNLEVISRWVDFLKPMDHRFDRMLAPDTASCWTQFAYHTLAKVTPVKDGFEVRIGKIKHLPESALQRHFFVKAPEEFSWRIRGGTLLSSQRCGSARLMKIRPSKRSEMIHLLPEAGRHREV